MFCSGDIENAIDNFKLNSCGFHFHAINLKKAVELKGYYACVYICRSGCINVHLKQVI